ncbi:MAG: YihY/virulence factor BrkB family protein [Gemmatimonadetes bacterium]|nr:YihY/virulence factor BrkB family protein [Gemmatimonadota bacterium]
MNPRALLQIFKEAAIEWDRDNVSRLAAALAYYAVFSLAPLLIIAIAVAGFLFGEEAARGQLTSEIQGLIGAEGAQAIQTMVEGASTPGRGVVATLVGIFTLFVGATGVFGQLQSGLNTVWEVSPKPGRVIKGMIRTRMLSFGLVVGIGFLLLVSLILSAALEAFNTYAESSLPEPPVVGWGFVNSGGSFILITLLFAMIYKILPDVIIPWRDVWLGAVVTSLLFTLGKYLIGLYLGNSSIGSTYGAAGTLAILLIWIYYSAHIFYFGAEVTQVYSNRSGSPIRPASYALRYVRVPVVVQDVTAASVEEIAREKISAGLAACPPGKDCGPDGQPQAKVALGPHESTLPGDPLDQQHLTEEELAARVRDAEEEEDRRDTESG